MPDANPSAAASATSCQASNGSFTLAALARLEALGHPARRALAEERGDALARLVGRADARNALGRVGDQRRVDRPVRDGAHEQLRLALRLRAGQQERAEHLVDA